MSLDCGPRLRATHAAARVHNAHLRRGSGVADGGKRAAAGGAVIGFTARRVYRRGRRVARRTYRESDAATTN